MSDQAIEAEQGVELEAVPQSAHDALVEVEQLLEDRSGRQLELRGDIRRADAS